MIAQNKLFRRVFSEEDGRFIDVQFTSYLYDEFRIAVELDRLADASVPGLRHVYSFFGQLYSVLRARKTTKRKKSKVLLKVFATRHALNIRYSPFRPDITVNKEQKQKLKQKLKQSK